MDFINSAYAADTAPVAPTATTEVPSSNSPQPGMPSQGDALIMNVGMVVVLGILFYLLLIRPQQKRFKEHNAMLGLLDKGSKVVTQGGLVGVIEKKISEHEVVVDFGNNVKMTMMRSYILGKYEDNMPQSKSIANDDSKKKDKNSK